MYIYSISKWNIKIGTVLFIVISVVGLYTFNGSLFHITYNGQTSATADPSSLQPNAYIKISDIDNLEYRKHTIVRSSQSEQTGTDTEIAGSDTMEHDNFTEIRNDRDKPAVQMDISTLLETKFKNKSLKNFEWNRKVQSLLDKKFDQTPGDPYNIMGMKGFPFSTKFKNPCWEVDWQNETAQGSKQVQCLPYFYLLGVKKSGTSDLYRRLQYHPQICSPGFKESQWLTRLRFGIVARVLNNRSLQKLIQNGPSVKGVDFFVSMFNGATECIMSKPQHGNELNRSLYYDSVTCDGTPAAFHMHTRWELLPGNEGLKEPRYTNYHYIKHLTPEAKILIIFRDPVTRLYSDFHHVMKFTKMENASKLFHDHVTFLIRAYEQCFKENTFRQCMYNNSLRLTFEHERVLLGNSFHAGFYAFFMTELLSVFRRDQIHPILMLDYINDMKTTLQKVFQFLELRPLDEKQMVNMLLIGVQNQKIVRKDEAMLQKTKALLTQFYKPYNKKMAKLMGDERYTFDVA